MWGPGERFLYYEIGRKGRVQCGGAITVRESAHVAQLVEHVLGKDEVSGSIPLVGSRNPPGDPVGRMKAAGNN